MNSYAVSDVGNSLIIMIWVCEEGLSHRVIPMPYRNASSSSLSALPWLVSDSEKKGIRMKEREEGSKSFFWLLEVLQHFFNWPQCWSFSNISSALNEVSKELITVDEQINHAINQPHNQSVHQSRDTFADDVKWSTRLNDCCRRCSDDIEII